jgi:hypothetical protein
MTTPNSKYDYTQAAPPRVRESVGYTVNLGNYETLRLDTSVEDVKRPNETMQEASDRLFNFAIEHLEARVKNARRTLRNAD